MSARDHGRLTALDESFLQMERPGLPMHVASAATFEAGPLLDADGTFRLEDMARHIDRRARLLPRLRQRVWSPPGGFDHARWVDDADFDVHRHIDVVAAPAPGDEGALRAVAVDTVRQLLDRDHPLWHMRFVTGLQDGRIGLIQRTHHTMVDGVSGVDVAAVLLDLERDPEPDEVVAWRPVTNPTVIDEIDDLIERARRLPASALSTVTRPVTDLPGTLRRGRTLLDALGTVLADGVRAPACSLNVPIGEHRELAWVRGRLSSLKEVGRRHGATVNDVLLTAIAGGLRAQLVHRGESLPTDRTVKVLVPVSLRQDDEHGALGNRVAAFLLALPIGLGDPAARLRATTEAMRRVKGHREDAVSDLLLGLVDALPVGVAATLARSVDAQPFVNLVVTNVPGPPFPLFLLGARMLEVFPIVPLGGNLSEEVAILSYEDAITIGITSDPDTCPDADVFVAGIERTLEELAAC